MQQIKLIFDMKCDIDVDEFIQDLLKAMDTSRTTNLDMCNGIIKVGDENE